MWEANQLHQSTGANSLQKNAGEMYHIQLSQVCPFDKSKVARGHARRIKRSQIDVRVNHGS